MNKRLWGVRGLVVLGGLLLVLGTTAVWVKRVVLQSSTWTDTSSKILQDPTVQQTLSTFIVDQLYANVDVAAQVRGVLPQQAKPLAGPAAAGLREFIDRAALRTLQTDQVQRVWRVANSQASTELIKLVDGGGDTLKTTNGNVVLDLHPMIEQVVQRAGIADRVQNVLPPDAGRITIIRSNNLKLLQDSARALKIAAYVLDMLAIVCFAAAIWLARDRRKALKACAIAVLGAALVLVFVRRVLGDQVVDHLVANEAFRPAAHSVWWIATDQLRLANTTLGAVGVVGLIGAWVAGPGEWACEVRRALTPYLRERVMAYGALAAVALLLLAWSPTPATRSWYSGIILLGDGDRRDRAPAPAGDPGLPRRRAHHDLAAAPAAA